MRSIRNKIIAVAAVAAMGAAAVPSAQAHDARPIIAGALIGAVVGGIIGSASAHSAPPAPVVYDHPRRPHVVYDTPVVVHPAPRVVHRPVYVYSDGPVHVEPRGHRHYGWRHRDDDRRYRDHDHRGGWHR